MVGEDLIPLKSKVAALFHESFPSNCHAISHLIHNHLIGNLETSEAAS